VVGGTEESPHGLSLCLRLRCSWSAEESKGGSAGCLVGQVHVGSTTPPKKVATVLEFEPTHIWIYLG